MTGAVLMESDQAGAPQLWCSSTLLTPDVVVLAAHCVDPEIILGLYPETTTLRFYWTREDDVSSYDGTGRLPSDAIEAIGAVYHASYSVAGFDEGIANNHDIALLFLAEVADEGHAYPVALDESEQLVEEAEVVVVGWGQQSTAPDSTGEKMMGVSTVGALGETEFLVGPLAADVRQCHGDSGGPVFLDVLADTTTPLRLVGVTSHAYDETACEEVGAVNTRIDAHLDWLDDQLRARCADGFRVWCEEPGLIFAPPAEDEEDNAVIDDGISASPGSGGGLMQELDDAPAGCSTTGGGTLWLLPLLLSRARQRWTAPARRPCRTELMSDAKTPQE